MEREKIKLDVSELRDCAFGDSEDYKLISSEITDTFRHGNENSGVIQRISDGKYFAIHWTDSVKDNCDFEDMNYTGYYNEVFPVEKTIIVFE